jgi:hypothetical protein
MVSCKDDPIIYPDGGYAFVNTDTIKENSFPCFPIRDLLETRDSLNALLMETKIMKLFDEPNISLKPSKKEIFRLGVSGMGIPVYYFTLTDGKIIVKKGLQNQMFDADVNKLSEAEQNLFYRLEMYILFHKKNEQPEKKIRYTLQEKREMDSCKKIGIAKCYKYLIDKSPLKLSTSFKYETRIITLPNHTFKTLIYNINNAGYWKMPLDLDCSDRPNDGTGFSLEANNGKKYNFVSSGDCMDPSTDFRKACQKIIKYAHYDKEIRIVHDMPQDK